MPPDITPLKAIIPAMVESFGRGRRFEENPAGALIHSGRRPLASHLRMFYINVKQICLIYQSN